MRRLLFAVLALSAFAVPCICGQESRSTPTLRVNAREVLVDIVVTDSHGNPVTGLPWAAFHVYDKGRVQTVNAFVEHRGELAANGATAAPTNEHFSAAAEPVRNVILIDTSRMDVVLQMTLYKQLLRLVHDLPPNRPLAVFWRSYASPVMLQNFTADHGLLDAAISRAIPHLQKFGAAQGSSFPEVADSVGPQRVAEYLAQVPGRKNLLWFIGGTEATAPLALANAGISPGSGETDGALRQTYAGLQTARVSVFPIDVRGIQPQNDLSLPDQHVRETAFAQETGGETFYNTNDAALAAEHAMRDGEDSYTLSYSPDDLRGDGSWHPIRVQLDGGPYQLSYRRGYFEDESAPSRENAREKKAMIGVKDEGVAQPDAHSQPLFFRAQPSHSPSPSNLSPGRGRRFWKVHFDVPAAEFSHTSNGGVDAAQAGAAIVAFNEDGRVVGHVSQKVTLKFADTAFKAQPNAALSFDQFLSVPVDGPVYLYIAVWDAETGRMGTIDLTLNAHKGKKK